MMYYNTNMFDTKKVYEQVPASVHYEMEVFNRVPNQFQNATYSTVRFPYVSVTGDVRNHLYSAKVCRSTIVIDEEKEIISRYSCSCSSSSSGICVHAAALALLYTTNKESGHIVLPELKKQKASDYLALNFLNSGPFHPVRDTTASFFLEPHIVIKHRYSTSYFISVSFRLGKIGQRAYVLQSVRNLIDKEINAQPYKLGKKLELIPCAESFAPSYRPLYNLLRSIIFENDEQHKGYYGNYSYRYLDKSIELTMRETDEFFDAVSEIPAYVTLDHQGREALLNINDEPPSYKTSLKRADKGYLFEAEPIISVFGIRHYYYYNPQQNTIHRTSASDDPAFHRYIEFVNELQDKTAYIHADDFRNFVTAMHPLASRISEVESSGFDLVKYLPMKPDFSFYLDKPQDNMITCEAFADYAGKKFSVFDGNASADSVRNAPEEASMEKAVASYFNSFDSEHHAMVIIDDDDRMVRFIREGIPLLQANGSVFISDSLKRLQIRTLSRVTFGVSMKNDLLQLDLTGEPRTLEDLAEILSRYTPKKKYYRLKNGSFIQVDNEDELEDLARFSEDLQLSAKDIRKGSVSLPSYRAMYIEKTAEDDSRIEVTRDSYFRDLIDLIEDTEKEYHAPGDLDQILREYQKEGFAWLHRLHSGKFAGLLADEMGLGKTLQVIAFIASLENRKQCIVICPASLVYNWRNEFRRFAPDIPVVMITGQAQNRKSLIESAAEDAVLVTSYDSLKRDIELYEGRKYDVEVVDEAQYIKNSATKAAESVKMIHSSFRIALTGTPIENRLSELWSIFDYLLPGFLYRYPWFRSHYESPIVRHQDKEVQNRLRKMISPFILRRKKMDVLNDLPEKLEEVYYAPLEGEQKELYEARRQRLKIMLGKSSDAEFNRNRIRVLAEITRLRQTCCSPSLIYENYSGNSAKEDMCIDLIRTAIEEGHKILLFSQFKTMLEKLNSRLEKEEISYYFLCGETPAEKRNEMVEAFQKDDVSVFSISLKAGGTGLNLTAADIVIHYDPWWNTAVENQASDRAHRIGQENRVTVYRLIVQDTIEERILQLQSQKSNLADEILSAEEMSSSALTREQLMEII